MFLLFFLEFFITRRVGTERNDNFYFLYFPAFSNLFWLEMNPQWHFLIFFAIFMEFCVTRRVGTERNGTIVLIFSLSHTFPTYVGLK